MFKIKKSDEIIVITGKDKGKRGKVLRLFPQKERVLVEGINLIKKHVKPDTRTGTTGGIVTKEATIHISNIAIYNPVMKKADKVGIKILDDGRKVRYFKSNKEHIDI